MVTDFLNRIKTAQHAKRESVRAPYSKINAAIAEILVRHHFVVSSVKKGRGVRKILEVKLAYEDPYTPIQDIKFLSKPSRRLYVGYRAVKAVKRGFGIALLSTPRGVVTGSEARTRKVGGELLCEIW